MSESTATQEFLTTKEVAAILRISRRSLENLRWRGGGPPYFKIGHCVRYGRKQLDEWIAERARVNTSEWPSNTQ